MSYGFKCKQYHIRPRAMELFNAFKTNFDGLKEDSPPQNNDTKTYEERVERHGGVFEHRVRLERETNFWGVRPYVETYSQWIKGENGPEFKVTLWMEGSLINNRSAATIEDTDTPAMCKSIYLLFFNDDGELIMEAPYANNLIRKETGISQKGFNASYCRDLYCFNRPGAMSCLINTALDNMDWLKRFIDVIEGQ